MSFLYKEVLFIPIVGILAAVCLYFSYEKLFGFLHKKSFSKRDDIIALLRLMGNEVDVRKVSITMILLSYGLGGLFFLALWPNFLPGTVLGLAVTISGWYMPHIFVKSLYEQRCGKFVDQMVDGLTIMANGIKAGSNPQESMKRVVEIMGNPIREEFGQVLREMQAGESFENALNNLGTRIPKPDVQMFVTAINILKETGGNLSETFTTIVLTVRERQKVEKKIQALTAQGLTQGIIVTLIPFILMLVFFFIDPEFIKPMFTTTLGMFLLMGMVVLQIIGGVMIKKIVTIKV